MTKNTSVVFMPHPPIIIPGIGRGEEKEAQKTIEGMHQLGRLIGDEKPHTIIFISPHGNSFSNGTCILYGETLEGDFSNFGYGDITFKKKVNKGLSKAIFEEFERNDLVSLLMDEDLGKRYGGKVALDHGAMVAMYFIDLYYRDYQMVHITPGFTSLEENFFLGRHIQKVVQEQDDSVLLLCSGDLSHALKDEGPYDYHPSGQIFDKRVKEAIVNRDAISLLTLDYSFVEEAGQCGLRSFLMGFGFVDGREYQSKVLSYEGPYGVGYLTGYLKIFKNMEGPSLIQEIKRIQRHKYQEKIAREDDYIKLARMAVETYVKSQRKLDFHQVEKEFSNKFMEEAQNNRAGVFVSIHNNGRLRGCIGTINPVQDNIIEEIIYNSISACSHDNRFHPIEAKEGWDLDIKVDVLMEPEAISSKEQLDVVKYGVIVEKGEKRGLLLPNLDGVDRVEEQVEIAMKKAGILDEKDMKLYRFQVIRHERKEKAPLQ